MRSTRTLGSADVLSRGLATAVSGGSRTASHRIVIVGGGAAGQAASHQLLRTGLFHDAADILLIDPSETHDYQPGWTLVGAGLKTREELRKPMKELIGEDKRLHYLQDAVKAFKPDENKLETRDGRSISYENLIVCPGIGIKWDAISGLKERLAEGKNVSSIYSYDTCANTYPMIDSLKKGKAIFTQPAGVIKCAGAPQKIMWLALDQWKKEGLYNVGDPTSGDVQITFASGMPTMFAAPKYNAALEALRKERNVEGLFGHNLTSIDGSVATFTVAGTEGKPSTKVQREFDLLHVTPPMAPLPFIKDSQLADPTTGFVEVDQGTTRHKRFSNIWSIGDSSSLPTSKTAAAITAQTPILVANLSAAVQGRTPEEMYDGYTSCPLLTEYGKVMMAEFKYGGVPKETFAPFGLDQATPNRFFFHLKRDFFPYVYYQSFVKGTWAGPKGWSFGNGSSVGSSTRAMSTFMHQRRGFASSSSTCRNTPVRRPRDPLDSAPNAVRHALPTGETFIVRPPPSQPSPLNKANSDTTYGLPNAHTAPIEAMPALRKTRRSNKGGEAQLTAEQIAQIQSLRQTDPNQHTAVQLARQFGCSPLYISMVAPISKSHRQTLEQKDYLLRSGWGEKKVLQKELRKERKLLW